MSLRDVLCQDRAVATFQQAVKMQRLGHAYIFAGNDGVGRYLMAKQWARALLCDEPSVDDTDFFDSCGKCRSCKLFDSDNHPDFKHIYKELIEFSKDASNRSKSPTQFPIDVVREFLVDVVASKPQMSEKVVYVVSEAEKMAAPAQNAMLKTLEEPPSYCLIILLCTRTDRLLPTILSRSQIVRFGAIDEDIIVNKLAESGLGREQGRFWARFTSGSLGEALTYASVGEGFDFYAVKCELLEKLACLQLCDSLDVAEWIVAKNSEFTEYLLKQMPKISKGDIKRRAQKMFLKIILSVVNDVMRMSIGQACDLINEEQSGVLERLCGYIDTDTAAKLVEKVNNSMQWVDAYVNEKLIFEEILLHFAKLKQ